MCTRDVEFNFERYGERTFRYHLPHVVALLGYMPSPGRVLDLGAGLGLFVEACCRNGIEAMGLEGSAEAVDRCRGRGLNVVHHDLRDPFPIESECMDVVFCNQVIEHLDDAAQRNLLSESYRVLRPGGVIMIYSPCRFNRELQRAPGHINMLTPRSLKRKLHCAGFCEIDLGMNYSLFGSGAAGVACKMLFRFVGPVSRFSASAHAAAKKSPRKRS